MAEFILLTNLSHLATYTQAYETHSYPQNRILKIHTVQCDKKQSCSILPVVNA